MVGLGGTALLGTSLGWKERWATNSSRATQRKTKPAMSLKPRCPACPESFRAMPEGRAGGGHCKVQSAVIRLRKRVCYCEITEDLSSIRRTDFAQTRCLYFFSAASFVTSSLTFCACHPSL